MDNTRLSELKTFFDRYRRFLIIGHREPDGDCIASQLILRSILRSRGSEAFALSPGPFVRPEVMNLADKFDDPGPYLNALEPSPDTAVVVMDSSTPQRTASLEPLISRYPAAVIDHHASGTSFGSPRLIDSSAPSTTFLVFELAGYLGYACRKEDAELLLFGLATDTGFFRHLREGSGRVFRAAAALTDTGGSPSEIFYWMYGNRSLDSRHLLGRLLVRITAHFDGRLLLTWEELADTEKTGFISRDSDTLYQLLQTTRETEVVILIREEAPSECSVGLRSNPGIDVGKAARDFGGGGHTQASGFTWNGDRHTVEDKIIAYFSPLMTGGK